MTRASIESSIRNAVGQASRLHRQLKTQTRLVHNPGPVDVFNSILELEVGLLIRPLNGLLGAYVRDPCPGILVTTERPLSIQRYTAAHELGHHYMKHIFSLDKEEVLRRSPFNPSKIDLQELEANVFAASFLMPRWLLARTGQNHGWKNSDYSDPQVVYQLSLRLGLSFQATIHTLTQYNYISPSDQYELSSVKPKSLKMNLLREYTPKNYRGDVWRLTKADEGTILAGSRNDLFVLELEENSSSGYLWNLDELIQSGFAITQDKYTSTDTPTVGGTTERIIATQLQEPGSGHVTLHQHRPWISDSKIDLLQFSYDLTGPETQGLCRVERQRRLQAA